MKNALVPFSLITALTLCIAEPVLAQKKAPVVPPRKGKSETIQLFNGKNLEGWVGHEKYWSVKDGVIIGKSTSPVPVSTYLLTKKKYTDFRLVFDFKLAKSEMHSGICFWGRVAPERGDKYTYAGHLVMFPSGYGFYDLYGRRMIHRNSAKAKKVGKQHDWNHMEILAQGNRIRFVLNGHLISDWRDPMPKRIKEAPIGLQLHSNKRAQEVQFKNLTLTTFPEDKLTTLKKGAKANLNPRTTVPVKAALDIFDHKAHKETKGYKKIAFIADTRPHGPRGNHEFVAAAVYLARTINENYPNVYCAVYTMQKFPKDLSHADAVVVLMNHGGTAAKNKEVIKAMNRGAGFMAIHYGVEVNKGEQGNNYLKWMGGYFETYWSVNPHWTANFTEIPKHETTRGVKPFETNDEWYYHMRFVKGMKGVTPVLSALPPLKTARKRRSPRGGNPTVHKEVSEGKKQVVAWAYERPDGGRGFGFTGLHRHKNLGNDSLRTLLLNATAWILKLKIPEKGIPSKPLDRGALEKLIDDGKLAVKRRGI